MEQWGNHGGPDAALGPAYYRYVNGVMRSGMLVCSFQLADITEGDGGFGVVPGSHKSNFQPPPEIVRSPTRDSGTEREGQRGDGIHLPVINPAAPIGSMLIFLEATFHTTLPWTNHDHSRRSLLYRYSPKYLHYSAELYGTSQPAWVSELTEEQQAVLEPPGGSRPELDDSGVLAQPLADGRVTYPPGEDVKSDVVPDGSNPTGSSSYQRARAGADNTDP